MVASKIMCYQCKLWEENGDGSQRICKTCMNIEDWRNDRNNWTALQRIKEKEKTKFPSDDVEKAMVVYPNDDEAGDKDNIFKNNHHRNHNPLPHPTALRIQECLPMRTPAVF